MGRSISIIMDHVGRFPPWSTENPEARASFNCITTILAAANPNGCDRTRELNGIFPRSVLGTSKLTLGNRYTRPEDREVGKIMAVWLVRAGQHGEDEETALGKGMAIIGWEDLPGLASVKTREQLASLIRKTYPAEGSNKLSNWTAQIWAFRERIQIDDLVVLPLKSRSAIALGRITGPYAYKLDRHVRSVKWLKTDIPRSDFDQDLLYSMGAFMTVCQISRNNAEDRINGLLGGRRGPATHHASTDDGETEVSAPVDLLQDAEDRIRRRVEEKFKGHALSRVVNAILLATGYSTQLSPPGRDGGVDIIAGRGAMGFESPRLCVQVKSSSDPVGVEVLRGLHGTMKNFNAEQGLLVAWGGFKDSVLTEARGQFFSIRLWDSGALIRHFFENYEKMAPDIQAELPLKRIWVLVE